MQTDNQLTFRWEKRAERYIFKCEIPLQGDADRYNEQLAEILRWCKAQKLKPGDFKFQAVRRAVTEKVEEFELDGRQGGFCGNTVFHPIKLRVELELPDRLGPMFTMAFAATDDRGC